MDRICLIVIIAMIAGCDVDEEPPETVSDLRGWFTINEGSFWAKITWFGVEDDDLDYYNIFRMGSDNNLVHFGRTELPGQNTFIDTTIEWKATYDYTVQPVDLSGNEGDHSDTIAIFIYSAGGLWAIPDYDSSSLCIHHNQLMGTFQKKGYNMPDGFSLIVNDETNSSTVSVGDTIFSQMSFSESSLDSFTWQANGWMTYQYTVLDTNILGDTVHTVSSDIPVYYLLDLANPESGVFSFYSTLFSDIDLYHTLKYCSEEDIFN